MEVSIKDNIQELQVRQSDSRGHYDDLIDKMKTENDSLRIEIKQMSTEISSKTEKIQWFERKLNKWVKLFDESEKENANRHNDMVEKINEVDRFYKRTCNGLDKRVKALESGAVVNGGNGDGDLGGKSSDNVSDLSR